MALPNSHIKKELERLGAYFVSIDVNNSHITYSKSKITSQIPDQAEGSLLLPRQIANSSINQGTIPCMIILPNLHLLTLGNSQYITLSVALFVCELRL